MIFNFFPFVKGDFAFCSQKFPPMPEKYKNFFHFFARRDWRGGAVYAKIQGGMLDMRFWRKTR